MMGKNQIVEMLIDLNLSGLQMNLLTLKADEIYAYDVISIDIISRVRSQAPITGK